MKESLSPLIDYLKSESPHTPPPQSSPSHNVYSVYNSDGEILFSKVGNADDSDGDIIITLNPDVHISGQVFLCKKSL